MSQAMETIQPSDLSSLTVLGEAAIDVTGRTPEEVALAGASIVAAWTGAGSEVRVLLAEEGAQRIKRILLVRPRLT
jgi:hypothetical protein